MTGMHDTCRGSYCSVWLTSPQSPSKPKTSASDVKELYNRYALLLLEHQLPYLC